MLPSMKKAGRALLIVPGSGMSRVVSVAVCLFAAGCLSSGGGIDRPECQAAPQTSVSYATQAQLAELLVGRWQRCASPQAPGEEVGVEFVAEGWWYPLIRQGGSVVRGSGSGGPWQYLPPGEINVISGQPDPHGQFVLDGVYTDPPRFTDAPRQMHVFFTPVPSFYVPLL
jgi:hypothetical protein